MFEFITENYLMVFVFVIVAVGFALWLVDFLKMDKEKRLKKIRRTAYLLVSEAEISFGSNKGREKFNYVHAMLSSKFRLFRLLPQELAYSIIENALDDLKEVLEEENENAEL